MKEERIIEDIEKIFEIIIPDEKALTVMMEIAIERKDCHRLLSYFDMIINMWNKLPVPNTTGIILRSLDFLINEESNLHFSFLFLENCIRSSKITCIEENAHILRDYISLINRQFSNFEIEENEIMQPSDVKLLVEIATDLPAHLKLLNIQKLLPDIRLQRDLYPYILHFFMKINETKSETEINSGNVIEFENDISLDMKNDGLEAENGAISEFEYDSELELDGNAIVYDLLTHWIDSYYITNDLWIDEQINGNMRTVLNLYDWSIAPLSVLFTFMILEQNGQSFINNGYKELFVQYNGNIDIKQVMNNLQNMYEYALQYEYYEEYPNIVSIHLQSWSNAINPAIDEIEEAGVAEYDSDSDGESFFLP